MKSYTILTFSTISAIIFEILTKFTKLTINFFSLTGYAINAKFLSRFLARKLKQNYSVKELLNPIQKELGYIGFITKYPLSNYFYSLNKRKFNKYQALEYRKGVFKYLYYFFFLYMLSIIFLIIRILILEFSLIYYLF